MISDYEIKRIIKRELTSMNQSSQAEDIESVKKIIKKKVGIFNRSSFLAYLFYQSFKKDIVYKDDKSFEYKSSDGKKSERIENKPFGNKKNNAVIGNKNNNNASDNKNNIHNSDIITQNAKKLWTNMRFFSEKKREMFIEYLLKESGLLEGSIYNFNSFNSGSFFKVKTEYADKLLNSFSTPKMYNNVEVSIRLKGDFSDRK